MNPIPIPSRGLGPGLLAGFFAWIVAVPLMTVLHPLGIVLNALLFGLIIGGLSAWPVRPTTWAAPVLFTALSVMGYAFSWLAANAIEQLTGTRSSRDMALEALTTPQAYLPLLTRQQGILAHLIVLLLVGVLSLTAVLSGRSRARRMITAGGPPGRPAPGAPGPYANRPPYSQGPPPPGPYSQGPPPPGPYTQGPPPPGPYTQGPPPPGPYTQGPPPPGPYTQGPPPPGPYPPASRPQGPPAGPPAGAANPPPPGYAPGPPAGSYGGSPAAYGPPAPVGGQPAPPMPPAAPAPPDGPTPGGTRRLDPDEFDQMLYEAEQERRAHDE